MQHHKVTHERELLHNLSHRDTTAQMRDKRAKGAQHHSEGAQLCAHCVWFHAPRAHAWHTLHDIQQATRIPIHLVRSSVSCFPYTGKVSVGACTDQLRRPLRLQLCVWAGQTEVASELNPAVLDFEQ